MKRRGLTTWGLTHRALFNAARSLLWNLSLQLFTACATGSILKKKHYRYHLRLRQSLEEKLIIKRARASPLTWHTVVFTLEPRVTFAANGKREFVPRDQVFPVSCCEILNLNLTFALFRKRDSKYLCSVCHGSRFPVLFWTGIECV